MFCFNNKQAGSLIKYTSEVELSALPKKNVIKTIFFVISPPAKREQVEEIEMTNFKKAAGSSKFFEIYQGLHQLNKNIQPPLILSPRAKTG